MKTVINRMHILIEAWEDEATALKRVQAEKKLTDAEFKSYKIFLYNEGSGSPIKTIEPVG